jgi:hypothetical protein
MQLKATRPTRIVTAMKRGLLLAALLLVPSLTLAQPFEFGILGGKAESMEDGFDFDFDQDVIEVFFAARIDESTRFRIKLGDADMPFSTDGDPINDGSLQYLTGEIEYVSHEIWGRSGIFAGPGVYRGRSSSANLEETAFGLVGGVNTSITLTRRIDILVELAYHWAKFEEDYTFITAAAGLKMSF